MIKAKWLESCQSMIYLMYTLPAWIRIYYNTVKPRFTGPLGGKELGLVNRGAR